MESSDLDRRFSLLIGGGFVTGTSPFFHSLGRCEGKNGFSLFLLVLMIFRFFIYSQRPFEKMHWTSGHLPLFPPTNATILWVDEFQYISKYNYMLTSNFYGQYFNKYNYKYCKRLNGCSRVQKDLVQF